MTPLECALERSKQTTTICAVNLRGKKKGHYDRQPLEVLAHPDLALLAKEIERLREALEKVADDKCGMDNWAEYNCCAYCAGKTGIAREALGSVKAPIPERPGGVDDR